MTTTREVMLEKALRELLIERSAETVAEGWRVLVGDIITSDDYCACCGRVRIADGERFCSDCKPYMG